MIAEIASEKRVKRVGSAVDSRTKPKKEELNSKIKIAVKKETGNTSKKTDRKSKRTQSLYFSQNDKNNATSQYKKSKIKSKFFSTEEVIKPNKKIKTIDQKINKQQNLPKVTDQKQRIILIDESQDKKVDQHPFNNSKLSNQPPLSKLSDATPILAIEDIPDKQQLENNEEQNVQAKTQNQSLKESYKKEIKQSENKGKLTSRQNTLNVLNKSNRSNLSNGRTQSYKLSNSRKEPQFNEIQRQVYNDRIYHLENQLQEKAKVIEQLRYKNSEFELLAKNNKKLIWQNARLKEQRVLLERQNDVLKNLMRKHIA